MRTIRIKIALSAVLLGLGAGASAAPYVILQGNQRVDGVAIRVKGDGSIVLTDAAGQQRTLSRAQVVRAVADKPAGFDQAVQQVQAGKYDEAIPVLEKIVSDMRFLSWDQQAVIPLTQALSVKNPEKAVMVFEGVLKDNPQLEQGPARWTYYSALAAAKRATDLEPKLDALVRTGSSADAAKALLVRGDLRVQQEQLESAVLDYLRVVHFYETETALLPEALFKAASTLEKRRDARSKDWYKRLIEEFPDSPQALEARGK
jgi:TolA-binding protein